MYHYSTIEVKYAVALEATKDTVQIKKFQKELEKVQSVELPLSLYCDNNGAITQAKERKSHRNPNMSGGGTTLFERSLEKAIQLCRKWPQRIT